jgi:hypothetical protein
MADSRCYHPVAGLVGPVGGGDRARVYVWCQRCGALGHKYRKSDPFVWWKPKPRAAGDLTGIAREWLKR